MFSSTPFQFDSDKIFKTLRDIVVAQDTHDNMGKWDINEPTGNFFYDPWRLKKQYWDTSIIELFDQLGPVGQAKVIIIKPGQNYLGHGDIEDRYHITLQGEESYLIDLEDFKMYPTVADNICYHMDTSRIHTAANFGYKDRIQLVIRKLLTRHKLKDPVLIKIRPVDKPHNLRYLFDKHFLIWLNKANKKGIINDVKSTLEHEIDFELERDYVKELQKIVDNCGFKVNLIQHNN